MLAWSLAGALLPLVRQLRLSQRLLQAADVGAQVLQPRVDGHRCLWQGERRAGGKEGCAVQQLGWCKQASSANAATSPLPAIAKHATGPKGLRAKQASASAGQACTIVAAAACLIGGNRALDILHGSAAQAHARGRLEVVGLQGGWRERGQSGWEQRGQ